MAAPQFWVRDTLVDVTYTSPSAEFWVRDTSVVVVYDGLMGVLDYVAGVVVATVGHSRVYNRHRHTRSRSAFEVLFTDSNGLQFWTVRRISTQRRRVGNLNATESVHTVRVEGIQAFVDADLAADSSEWQMQIAAEQIADALRPDVTLNGLAELAWNGVTQVVDEDYAGVACNVVRLDLQVQMFTTG